MSPGLCAVAGGISKDAATVALALASAMIWGTSDFVGGVVARRLPASAVVLLSHGLSLLMLVSLAVALRSPLPDRTSALFGLTGGLACGTGVIVLYKALALGGMGLTAAVSGVIAAVLPVLWGFATEGLPTGIQVAGIGLAAASIWMIARSPGAASSRQGVLLGAVAGASFGALFILLKLAGRGGVLWPLACSRAVSSALAALVTWFNRRRTVETPVPTRTRSGWPVWLSASLLGLVAMTGIFDASGNSFYILATRLGRLDIAAVLSSLYPASTILLAALLLKERTTRSQTFGIALALVAVVLISA